MTDNVHPVFKPILESISKPFCECGWYSGHLGKCPGKPVPKAHDPSCVCTVCWRKSLESAGSTE